MKVTQVYEILNTIVKEHLGETAVVNEDLTNVVDIGKAFEDTIGLDNYVKALTNHIGKVVVKNMVYEGRTPSVLRDSWEFGSILQKITCDMPDAVENESWTLTKGQTVDQDIFNPPTVREKFYNGRTTFEIDMSYTEKQVKESFDSAMQLNAFYSMISVSIQNKMTMCMDGLIMRTTNNMIGATIAKEFEGGNYNAKSGVRAVNLLYLYNNSKTPVGKLTVKQAVYDPDFIKFASRYIGLTADHMADMSTLFNMSARERFTPKSRMHLTLLSDFAKSANVYLQSDTFHEEYTALPNSETVSYWQGSGVDYGFDSVSKIDVKTSDGKTVTLGGILGIMYDHDAIAVTNVDQRARTHYNEKGEFWNVFHKADAGYLNDYDENFVVFFVA